MRSLRTLDRLEQHTLRDLELVQRDIAETSRGLREVPNGVTVAEELTRLNRYEQYLRDDLAHIRERRADALKIIEKYAPQPNSMLEFQAPQTPCWMDAVLANERRNKRFAEWVLERRTEVLEDTPEYQIVTVGTEKRGYIAFVSHRPLMIAYLVRYAEAKYDLLDVPATRIKLWRQHAVPGVPGLTRRVFFDYLLDRHPAIISDGPQRPEGREFWISRLAEATNLVLRVAVIDADRGEANWYGSGSARFKQWWAENESLGVSQEYRSIRYVIAQPR
jgi:hypothetical protein